MAYLVDLVYKRKWSPGLLCQAHEVEDRRQRPFSPRLSLTRQQLQLFAIAELDENVNGPFLVVFMRRNANFSGATDTWSRFDQYKSTGHVPTHGRKPPKTFLQY